MIVMPNLGLTKVRLVSASHLGFAFVSRFDIRISNFHPLEG
jgi:hypothetical protein